MPSLVEPLAVALLCAAGPALAQQQQVNDPDFSSRVERPAFTNTHPRVGIEHLPVVVIATHDPKRPESLIQYEKTLSNIKEVKAREGIVIALANRQDREVREAVDYTIELPPTDELLFPILEIVPLQLLAYHIGVRRGCDVDQPRNLAKSVTDRKSVV